ncbi:hypothetical protein ACOMHN_049410 [Nucella lapillus]
MAATEEAVQSTAEETESNENIPVFTDGQLSYLGHDAEEIPEELVREFADRTIRLDLSFNRIQRLEGLEQFTSLRELILDNNELDDSAVFPRLPSLTTLYLNKNLFVELEPLLVQLKTCFPDLLYLSLLGNTACPNQLSSTEKDDEDYQRYRYTMSNTACPNQLSSTEKDDEDYQRYRYFVLFQLPKLKFLDSSVVRQCERMEAKRRGQFMQVVRPQQDMDECERMEAKRRGQFMQVVRPQQDMDECERMEAKRRGQFMQVVRPQQDMDEEGGGERTPQFTPLPSDTERFEDSKHIGFYSKNRYKYHGRHSEGNRFIRNKDL